MADPGACCSALELAELQARDPLQAFRDRALKESWLTEADCEAAEQAVRAVVEEAVRFAAESPPPLDLNKNVYAEALDLYGGRP